MSPPEPTRPAAGGNPAGSRAGFAVAIGVAIVASGFVMYLVTTFLFAFSGGQYRMVLVVNVGALGAMATGVLAAAAGWRRQGPATGLKWALVANGSAWMAVVVIEWALSFSLGAG